MNPLSTKSTLLFAPAGLLALSSGLVQVHGAQVEYFLKLDNIQGESTDSQHKGWIELESFSWGASNTASIGSDTGGAGAGKVKFNDMTATKVTDKTSPSLFVNCIRGTHTSGTLEVVSYKLNEYKEQQAETVVLRLNLTDVAVDLITEAGIKLNQPTESLSLNFTKVEVSDGGKPGTTGPVTDSTGGNTTGILDTVTDGN